MRANDTHLKSFRARKISISALRRSALRLPSFREPNRKSLTTLSAHCQFSSSFLVLIKTRPAPINDILKRASSACGTRHSKP